MKRILVILTLALAFTAVSAEEHYIPHISVGAHAGMDLSKVSFSPSIDQGWLSGPQAGVQIRYAEEKLFGLVGEFNYGTRGWSEKFENSPLQYSRMLHYISVPLMTHIYFGPPRTKFFFNLGPEFSFLLAQNTTSNFDYTDPTNAEGWPEIKRMTDQLTMQVNNRFDYGICVGFGMEYYLQPRHSVYLETRYYYGLGNIYPSSKSDVFGASRNMSLAVTLGYNFRLK